jgi:hydrogenase expression/formation protein HypC
MCLAIPGEIVEVYDKHALRFAMVQFGGITREVCLEYQRDAVPGEFVLVHVGFAIAKVDREEAARTWATLRELGELAEVEP